MGTKKGTRCVIAIDLGTSGAKVALVTAHGRVLGWEYTPVPVYLLPEGGAEQDPEDWWRSITKSVKRLMARRLVPREAVEAVCTSAMGEETVPVDRNGKCLMRSMSWMDSRAADHVRELVGGPIALEGYDVFKMVRWVRTTGGAPSKSGKDPAGHMQFIKRERPDVFERTYKFLNSLDYVNMRLTGNFVASLDSIMTSWATDTRNIASVTYSEPLLKIMGIPRDKLPELVRSTDIVGTLRPQVAREWGVPEKVKVAGGSIDVSASAVGAGTVEDYRACLYLGTSSYLVAHVPFKKTDIFHGMASLPCAVPGKYLLMNNQTTAGGNLTFLRDRILYHKDALLKEGRKPDVFKIFDEICAQVPPGSNGVVYTPWLYGERTPVDDHLIRGGIHNLSLENTRGDIIRAVFEGVALNTRWMLGPAEKFITRRMDPIAMTGGGASSDIWCRICADVLGRTIRQVKDPIQVNARGAALIASVALGHISFSDVPGLVEIRKVYEPDARNRALYDGLYPVFLKLYEKNKGIYHRLNRHKRV